MAGLFETITKEDPTFVSDSEKNAKAAAESAANAKQYEDLARGYSESAAASAVSAETSASSITGILDQVTVLRDETQVLHDSTETIASTVQTEYSEIVDIKSDVTSMANQVRVDRDTTTVAMQNASISANNAEAFSQDAQQSVTDASDQVELAKDEVDNAKAEVVLATAQADRAQTIADTVQDEVDLAHDWAVKMDGMVAGEDYSAKYWAAQAENAAAGGVASFNGRAGIVSPQAGDYTVAQVTGAVPSTRTINGKALSADIVLTAADIGVSDDALLKANNLSDVASPSTALTNLGGATTASVALKANIASPTFTGTVTAPIVNSNMTMYNQNYNFSIPAVNYSYIGHHKDGANEMDFVNGKGTLTGGFRFYTAATAANMTEVYSIDGVGNHLNTNNVYFQSRLASTNVTANMLGVNSSNVLQIGDSVIASQMAGSALTINNTALTVNSTSSTFNNPVTFNGTVALGSTATGQTVATTDSTTKLATTAFVKNAITDALPVTPFVSTANPGDTAFPTTVFTKVPYYSPTYGASMFATDTFTAPSAGLYQFNFEVRFDRATAALAVNKEYMLTIGPTTAPTGGIAGQTVGGVITPSTNRCVSQMNTVIKMTAGQQMCSYIWHNNGSNITVAWATLKITKIGTV